MLTRRFVRRVVGQPTSSFDMGQILDGGILLCRLPKGVLGDDTTRLLGSLRRRLGLAGRHRPRQPDPNASAATR